MSHELVLPVLTRRNSVLFPHVAQTVTLERPRSLAALEAALRTEDRLLAVFAQHDARAEDPSLQNLYRVGTLASVKQVARSKQGVQVTLLGFERIALGEGSPTDGFPRAAVTPQPPTPAEATALEARQRQVLELATKIQKATGVMPGADFRDVVTQLDSPMHLVYLLGSMLHLTVEKAQVLLGIDSPVEATELLARFLSHELQVVELEQQIARRARTEIDREQRQYYLRRQLQAIREELGESTPEGAEALGLKNRLDEADLPDAVRHEARRDLDRLANLPAAAPDFQILRAYLELVLELPWTATTRDDLDLSHARAVLDEDHHGLDDVKERILEHLAVLKLNPDAKAPILCFVGPPGVGKTSLGTSIARALGRRFERLSVGGLRDEAELRGHRRTYVGALPGRIVQAVRRAGVRNPVLMLDEIDKTGRDYRGDPMAALLEILDPSQNQTFRDNYLEMPFDLSKVFFIATANAVDTLSRPLLDRLEVLRLPGYGNEEKVAIARRYLLPRQRAEAGLTEEQLEVPEETLARVVRRYTREAGVRELDRMLGRLARKVALLCAEKGGTEGNRRDARRIVPPGLGEFLGPERFEAEDARHNLPPGVVPGLAWTEAGGDVLYVEAVRSPRDEMTLTGQLGDVMKESAQAAHSYVLSQAEALGVDLRGTGVHVHVPAGAIPKDGPSAGITMATAVVSALSGRPVRHDLAMTGELTLSGRVLPIGGVKEKILGGVRAGIRSFLLPAENEADLEDLPKEVRREIKAVAVHELGEVLALALYDAKYEEGKLLFDGQGPEDVVPLTH